MKPDLRQIQIDPSFLCHYMLLYHTVNLTFRNLNRTAVNGNDNTIDKINRILTDFPDIEPPGFKSWGFFLIVFRLNLFQFVEKLILGDDVLFDEQLSQGIHLDGICIQDFLVGDQFF